MKISKVRLHVLIMAGTLLFAKTTPGHETPEAPTVVVSVFNDAKMPEETVRGAEEVAQRVFRRAGLRVEWINCGGTGEADKWSQFCSEASFPTHLQLRILRRPHDLTERTFGVSYLGADGKGCYSNVFAEQAETLHAASGASIESVLGLVAAHEVAHLLLGTNSHSAAGIMRGRWESVELAEAGKGELIFSREQADRMKNRIATSVAQNAPAHAETAAAGH